MTIHQLVATAARFDAVTGQALELQSFLAGSGIAGEVFAENIAPGLTGRVRPLRELDRVAPSDRVILRYSIWSGAAERFLARPPRRDGLIYHNITPARFFRRTNPMVAELCERGRRELPRFADHVAVALADSTFNAHELESMGFRSPRVVPLLLPALTPPAVLTRPAPRVLTVGRIVPNKRLEEVIRVVALVRDAHRPDIRLDIVGSADGFEPYAAGLRRFAETIGAADAVRFHGRVDDAARDRLYAEAGVYLTMSAHEGFCVPVVEAMSRGLPVVANAVGAIPETLGDAGLLVPADDPAVAAEAVHELLGNGPLRSVLHERAGRRLRSLDPRTVGREILSAIDPLLS